MNWGENFDECYEMMSKFEGVVPLCIVNCLNFGDPKYSMYDLYMFFAFHCMWTDFGELGAQFGLFKCFPDPPRVLLELI